MGMPVLNCPCRFLRCVLQYATLDQEHQSLIHKVRAAVYIGGGGVCVLTESSWFSPVCRWCVCVCGGGGLQRRAGLRRAQHS